MEKRSDLAGSDFSGDYCSTFKFLVFLGANEKDIASQILDQPSPQDTYDRQLVNCLRLVFLRSNIIEKTIGIQKLHVLQNHTSSSLQPLRLTDKMSETMASKKCKHCNAVRLTEAR